TITQDDQFTYDVFDRRIGKLVLGGTQQWMAYDGANPYVDFTGTTLTTRYLYGRAVDTLFAKTDASGGNTSWYLPDLLRSVRQNVRASDGLVQHTVTYTSFGVPTDSADTNGDRFKYTSREWDS